jgi:hypothetical protein
MLRITVDCSEVSTGEHRPPSQLPGLELPKLMQLHLACVGQHRDQTLSGVLGRSCLPALTAFSLNMRSTADDVPGLSTFLDAHSSITELKLQSTPDHIAIQLLNKAQYITRFETRIPHVDVIKHLPAACRTLAFRPYQLQSMTKIRAIAEGLTALPTEARSLREIHLTGGFLWNEGLRLNVGHDTAMLYGQLLHVAACLRDIGICIRDSDGAMATVAFSL